MNVLYRKSGRDTVLWSSYTPTGDKWKMASVPLPNCPTDFQVFLENVTWFYLFRSEHNSSVYEPVWNSNLLRSRNGKLGMEVLVVPGGRELFYLI